MRNHLFLIAILLSGLAAGPAAAATAEADRVAAAADVIEELTRIPEQSIPPALLARAYAVAVIPEVIKVGFGIGARRGKGVLVVRQDNGSWSNPAFVTLTGGSVGFQIGAQSTDVILVFKSNQSVEGIANGRMTLGVDASIAAGPVGRQTGAHTDVTFQAEVYSYSKSRGLFAGIALEGAGVSMDRLANAAFYAAPDMTPERIFASPGNIAPPEANRLVQLLAAQTSNLPAEAGPAGDSAAGGQPRPEPATESTVRTYGIPDPEETGH